MNFTTEQKKLMDAEYAALMALTNKQTGQARKDAIVDFRESCTEALDYLGEVTNLAFAACGPETTLLVRKAIHGDNPAMDLLYLVALVHFSLARRDADSVVNALTVEQKANLNRALIEEIEEINRVETLRVEEAKK